MTEQEIEKKARELVESMYLKIEDATAGLFEENVPYIDARQSSSKHCAIICCDEVLKTYEGTDESVANNGAEILFCLSVKQFITDKL